ncbi:HAD family hydrolase [Listeria costaricensis]|uniref:HAD family hydrolase n=1 Tax=Listeria costaricensis TaxID=2026604 RepID=UPI000C08558B|nr:HAD-IA family hydrolase [Listeria costaricensis]
MKAIIFDFDGTMIDTENLWREATMKYLKETYDIDLPNEIYESIIGTSEEPLHRYLIEQTKGQFDIDAFTTHVKGVLHQEKEGLVLREGFQQVFELAVKKELKIGLATSSGMDWVVPVLEKFDLLPYFSTIQTAEKVASIKPHPALYLQALEELDVAAEQALAVEDSLNGAISALEAGLHVVAVPNEATKRITFPKEVQRFESFDELDLTSFLA